MQPTNYSHDTIVPMYKMVVNLMTMSSFPAPRQTPNDARIGWTVYLAQLKQPMARDVGLNNKTLIHE